MAAEEFNYSKTGVVGYLQRRYDCRAKLVENSSSKLGRFSFEH